MLILKGVKYVSRVIKCLNLTCMRNTSYPSWTEGFSLLLPLLFFSQCKLRSAYVQAPNIGPFSAKVTDGANLERNAGNGSDTNHENQKQAMSSEESRGVLDGVVLIGFTTSQPVTDSSKIRETPTTSVMPDGTNAIAQVDVEHVTTEVQGSTILSVSASEQNADTGSDADREGQKQAMPSEASQSTLGGVMPVGFIVPQSVTDNLETRETLITSVMPDGTSSIMQGDVDHAAIEVQSNTIPDVSVSGQNAGNGSDASYENQKQAMPSEESKDVFNRRPVRPTTLPLTTGNSVTDTHRITSKKINKVVKKNPVGKGTLQKQKGKSMENKLNTVSATLDNTKPVAGEAINLQGEGNRQNQDAGKKKMKVLLLLRDYRTPYKHKTDIDKKIVKGHKRGNHWFRKLICGYH